MTLADLEVELESAHADLKAAVDEVQPYNRLGLTSEENDQRNGIINGRIIPARNRFQELEIQISHKRQFEGVTR
jgi:hypothetical protein